MSLCSWNWHTYTNINNSRMPIHSSSNSNCNNILYQISNLSPQIITCINRIKWGQVVVVSMWMVACQTPLEEMIRSVLLWLPLILEKLRLCINFQFLSYQIISTIHQYILFIYGEGLNYIYVTFTSYYSIQ